MPEAKASIDLPAPAWAKPHARRPNHLLSSWPCWASFVFLLSAALVFVHSLLTDSSLHTTNKTSSPIVQTPSIDGNNTSQQSALPKATSTSSKISSSPIPAQSLNEDRFCPDLPDLDKILLVFKTGATASHKRVPPHLDTTLSCLPKSSYVIVSDLDETLTHGNTTYRIHDVLAPGSSNSSSPHHVSDLHPVIPKSRLMDDPAFELYRALRAGHAQGRNLTKEIDSLASDSSTKEDGQGWKLDKWKFLPMLSFALDAVHNRPNVDWFFFVEADTYFSMRNLLMYLYPNGTAQYDAGKPWYLGSPSTFGTLNFAHGGSGFLLSKSALTMAVNAVESDPRKYEQKTDEDCCGDNVIAKVLEDVGVLNTGIWPVIQGETPASLDYLSGGDEDPAWCREVTTWHHADSEIIKSLWNFEQNWWRYYPHEPIRHSDIFWHFIMPELGPRKDAWDNDSKSRMVTYSKDMDEENEETAKPDSLIFDELAEKQHDVAKETPGQSSSESQPSPVTSTSEHTGTDRDSDEESQHIKRATGNVIDSSFSSLVKKDEEGTIERLATLSFEGCRAFCEADSSCMQFSYITGECGTTNSIRLGTKLHGLVKEGRKSGWMMNRIRKKAVLLDEKCPSAVSGGLGALAGE